MYFNDLCINDHVSYFWRLTVMICLQFLYIMYTICVFLHICMCMCVCIYVCMFEYIFPAWGFLGLLSSSNFDYIYISKCVWNIYLCLLDLHHYARFRSFAICVDACVSVSVIFVSLCSFLRVSFCPTSGLQSLLLFMWPHVSFWGTDPTLCCSLLFPTVLTQPCLIWEGSFITLFISALTF